MIVYDSDIRQLLFNSFFDIHEYIASEDTIIVNEMDVCSGISRVAVVNGKLHSYEIKSGQDTLERLPQQIRSYNQVFDTMTIVAFENHIDKIKKLVPDWWGITCVTENNNSIILKTARKGKKNKNTNIQSVTMLLWRDEMIDLLLTYGGQAKSYKSKSRYNLSKMIVDCIEAVTIEEYVRNALKTRSTWKAVQLQPLYDDWHRMLPNS